MTLTTARIEALDGINALAATISYSLHGHVIETDPVDAVRVRFEDADPVRQFIAYPHKRYFEGRFWLASTDEHVPFESFWERSFLASLDRTGRARSVTSQPSSH